MTLIYFFGFIAMIAIYGTITNRLNARAKCNHIWEDKGDGGIKCTKCNKSIRLQSTYENEHAAA
jgi:hypothetical protein